MHVRVLSRFWWRCKIVKFYQRAHRKWKGPRTLLGLSPELQGFMQPRKPRVPAEMQPCLLWLHQRPRIWCPDACKQCYLPLKAGCERNSRVSTELLGQAPVVCYVPRRSPTLQKRLCALRSWTPVSIDTSFRQDQEQVLKSRRSSTLTSIPPKHTAFLLQLPQQLAGRC